MTNGYYYTRLSGLNSPAVIGGGASTFFGNVSDGIKTSLQFVEDSPTLKNLSQETQHLVQEQASNVVKEMN